MQIERMLLGILPIVAKAAELDVEHMGWADMDGRDAGDNNALYVFAWLIF